jgi:hypothetical protein
LGYVNIITKQYRIYALDLHHIFRTLTIDFDKYTSDGTIDLKVQVKPILTALPNRNPVGRPRKQKKKAVDNSYIDTGHPINQPR